MIFPKKSIGFPSVQVQPSSLAFCWQVWRQVVLQVHGLYLRDPQAFQELERNQQEKPLGTKIWDSTCWHVGAVWRCFFRSMLLQDKPDLFDRCLGMLECFQKRSTVHWKTEWQKTKPIFISLTFVCQVSTCILCLDYMIMILPSCEENNFASKVTSYIVISQVSDIFQIFTQLHGYLRGWWIMMIRFDVEKQGQCMRWFRPPTQMWPKPSMVSGHRGEDGEWLAGMVAGSWYNRNE